MAHHESDWEIVRVYYELGYSLGEIVKAPKNTAIKDRALISRRAAKEGWIKGAKTTLIEKRVNKKQLDIDIERENATLKTTELALINNIVDDKVKDLAYISTLTQKNLSVLEKKINKNLTVLEHYTVQNTIAKGRESIEGKSPPVTNNVQINTVQQFTDEQLKERAIQVNEYLSTISNN